VDKRRHEPSRFKGHKKRRELWGAAGLYHILYSTLTHSVSFIKRIMH